jgi:hypothetical protein
MIKNDAQVSARWDAARLTPIQKSTTAEMRYECSQRPHARWQAIEARVVVLNGECMVEGGERSRLIMLFITLPLNTNSDNAILFDLVGSSHQPHERRERGWHTE